MDIDQSARQSNSSAGRGWLRRFGRGMLFVICAIAGLSAASNLFFRARSDSIDRLTDLDKARVGEAFRLRRAVGDSIWPGWSNAMIPVLLYNEAYVFLCGCSDNPGAGWRTVPQNLARGGPWESVLDDSIDGRRYYRQRLVDEHASPQAFTVRVGEFWAASMTTKDWTRIGMGNEIRDSFPFAIKAFVPYRLMAWIFLKLAMNTDGYVCGLEHESFHAYQGMISASRLASAESVLSQLGRTYPWTDPPFSKAWKEELSALADALSATQEKRMAEFAQRFMALRRDRRKAFHLDSALVNLERLREWEEGLGKYTELAVWKLAASDTAHKPVNALNGDQDFNGYRNFSSKWAQELVTLRLQSRAEEVRFYYSGMAQAFLLDRLNPDWRRTILQGDVFLEDLLGKALTTRRE